MTKSEKISSILAQMFFYEEFVYDNLCFFREDGSRVELADVLINLDDVLIVIQIKERSSASQTNLVEVECRWLHSKIKKAKSQIQNTISYIAGDKLPYFVNTKGQQLKINQQATLFPIIIFDNDTILDYQKVIHSRSRNIDIHCFSITDFQAICRLLWTPIEIVDYLQYRAGFFQSNNDSISKARGSFLTILKTSEPDAMTEILFAQNYITREYSQPIFKLEDRPLQLFRYFLKEMKNHLVVDQGSRYIVINALLSKLSRMEIYYFMERLYLALKDAKNNIFDCSHFMINVARKTGIVFMASNLQTQNRISLIAQTFKYSFQLENVLCVNVYWEDNLHHRIDFCLIYGDWRYNDLLDKVSRELEMWGRGVVTSKKDWAISIMPPKPENRSK
jgi:hypothetical protein